MSTKTVQIGYEDIDAIARLVEAEAGSVVGAYGMDRAYGTIIDVIINRYAADYYSVYDNSSIKNIIEADGQFSVVTGTWDDLDPASQDTYNYVVARLTDRVAGEGSFVGFATHYFNETRANPSWEEKMVNTIGIGEYPYDGNGDQLEPPNDVESHTFGNILRDYGALEPLPNDYILQVDFDDDGFESGETSGVFDRADTSDMLEGDFDSEIDDHDFPPFPIHKPDVDGVTEEELQLIAPGAGGDDDDGSTPTDGSGWVDTIIGLIQAAIDAASPLVLDLDGDGVELTSLNSAGAVYWDIDLDGLAEASGWVDSDDGLLAIDADQDGIINDSTELFGDQTGYGNGFLALATYDSNQDGLITAEDAAWDDLRIWIDGNANGYSESDELHTMDDLLITEIDLGYSDVSYSIAGNEVLQESSFVIDGNTRDIVDAWFTYSNVNTLYNQEFTFDYQTIFLPTLRGYGELPEFRITMSLDNDDQDPDSLLSLVTDLDELELDDIFTDDNTAMDAVEEIMFRWAGVDGLSGDERGPNIDSRQLGFLEALMGQAFVQGGSGGQSNPGAYASLELEEAFHIAQASIYARLVAQGAGGGLLEGDWYYDVASDSIEGVTGLDSNVLDELETEATGLGSTAAREAFWQNVVRMVEYTVGTGNLPGGDQTALDDAITNSDGSLSLSGIVSSLEWNAPTVNVETGDSGNNTLTGGSGIDDISGLAGDDTLEGGYGDDTLDGGADDDELWGEVGSDYILGDFGEDNYHWEAGHGHDIIQERGTGAGNTNDRIVLGSGFDSGDLTLTRISNTALLIEIDNGVDSPGSFLIESQFNYSAGGGHVELIEFYDTSTYDLDAQAYTLTGTSGNDVLSGSRFGSNGSDTIYGGAGNDTIYGYAPNETDTAANFLYGQDGDDKIYGGAGVDTIDGGDGDDYISAGNGNDDITMGTGDDEAYGGNGDDTYRYVSGHDVIWDQSGTDVIRLDAAWDSVTPTYYKQSNDLKIVFDEDNTILIESFFGDEVETMIYDDTTSVDLTSVSYTVQGDESNNSLSGTSGNDTFYGFGGNDTLSGNNGDDTLYGGTGDDTLNGNNNDDYLDGGAGDDNMYGGNGNDHYYFVSGHDVAGEVGGADILEITPGWTWEDLSFERHIADLSNLVIAINGSNSITITDMFASSFQIETLRMNDGTGDVNMLDMGFTTHGDGSNNTLYGVINGNFNGGVVDEVFYGHGGNDTIYAYSGDDVLDGGDGDDTLYGSYGSDTYYLGAGNDYVDEIGGGDEIYYYSGGLDEIYQRGGGTDILHIMGGTTINDIAVSDIGNHELIVIDSSVNEIQLSWFDYNSTYTLEYVRFDDGFITTLDDHATWDHGTASGETVTGDSGNNTVIGYAGNDTLEGLAGADAMHGGTGNDTLEGGDGDDLLHGGDDDDLLYGADGLDTLFGGDGADTFVFENASAFNDIDVVKDFNLSDDDVLDLIDILDATSFDPGQDAVTDWIELTTVGNDTAVKVDRDGTGGGYSMGQVATLEGVTGLTDEQALVNSGHLLLAA